MTEVPRADVFSFDVDSPDQAILTYTVHGAKCRIALGYSQVDLIRQQAARVKHAMDAAREARSGKAAAVER